MASNTKLDVHQKQERKILKKMHPAVTLVNNGKTTIAFMLKGNTVQFSTSVMSPEEVKFRRKVGEYFALLNYDKGIRVSMDKYDFLETLNSVFGVYEDADTLAANF